MKKTESQQAPATLPEDRLWDIDEAIYYLGIPRSTFYLELGKGEIKGQKIGRHTKFFPENIKAYARSRPTTAQIKKPKKRTA